MIGADIWEITLVLFDHYRYKCVNTMDIEVWCRSHAGEYPLIANKDLHISIASSALKGRDAGADGGYEHTIISLKNIPECVLVNLCETNKLLYLVYKDALETELICGFDEITVEADWKMLRVFCNDYHSRIRNKSVVNVIFNDNLVFEELTCHEDPEGNVAKLILTDEVDVNDLSAVRKVLLSRKKEKSMCRENLRKHVYLISQSTYELGQVLNHFYKIKPLTQVSLPLPPSMLDLLNSTHLNSLQKLGVRQSLYPLSIVVGPPGTGKTRTLASIVCAAYLDGEGVLCLGKSNVAVRRLCQEIAKGVPRDDLGLVV